MFKKLKEELEDDLPEFSLDDKIARYGYLCAFYEMERLTLKELEELRALLGLDLELVESLKI
jgi:hypothetical protein